MTNDQRRGHYVAQNKTLRLTPKQHKRIRLHENKAKGSAR